MAKNYYEILHLLQNATEPEVKERLDEEFRHVENLARIPNRRSEAATRKQVLEQAQKALLDPSARGRYDASLEMADAPRDAIPPVEQMQKAEPLNARSIGETQNANTTEGESRPIPEPVPATPISEKVPASDRQQPVHRSGPWIILLGILCAAAAVIGVVAWQSAEEQNQREASESRRRTEELQQQAEQSRNAAAEAQRQLALERERLEPRVTIERVWEDHNQEQDGQKGMLIHAAFQAKNFQEQGLEFIAFFNYDDDQDTKLENSEAACKTAENQVCAHDFFKPPEQSSGYADFKAFLPYDDIGPRVSGSVRMKYQVVIRRAGTSQSLASSEWRRFTFNRSSPVPDPEPLRSPPPIPSSGGDEGIRGMLAQWAESFKQKDVRTQADCYAPEVDIYFRKRNVSQNFVAENKARAFAAIAQIRKFEINDIKVSFESPDQATVTFNKTWDTTLTTGKPYGGSELERLDLTLVEGKWRIKREEELRIYYVTH